LDTEISTEEVHLAIDRMKDGKASGADGLCAELFKNLDEVTLYTLTKLLNKVLQLGHFPASWAQGLITPIHKGGDPDCVNNYRGITFLPVVAKIFFAVMENRIKTWANAEGIIPNHQFGFRKGHRTSDAIFVLNSLLEKMKWKRKRFCCFIDFQKAFDSVSHGLLWKKLSNLGVSSQMCTILHSMYSQAQSVVCTSRGCTEQIQCDKGVRQGCPLSPTLFALYTNDLMSEMSGSGVKLYLPLGVQVSYIQNKEYS